MTMIGIATYGDRAEIITDSSSYRRNGSRLGRNSKVLTIVHLDTAVATQGDSSFGVDAKSAVLQMANQVSTFDDLIDAAPDQLRTLWANRRMEWADASDSTVFIVGYSPRAERFESFLFATDFHDLKAIRLSVPWVTPCPWSLKPHSIEMKRLRDYTRDAAARYDHITDNGHLIVQKWATKPQLTAPATEDEWIDLARTVREERALENFATVYVAGDVFHTRIARGEATTRKVFSYDDSGQEFLQMISGTQHPIAQLMDCWCESGKAYVDCHLADQLDEPCGCRTSDGKTFRECCAVDTSQLSVLAPSVST